MLWKRRSAQDVDINLLKNCLPFTLYPYSSCANLSCYPSKGMFSGLAIDPVITLVFSSQCVGDPAVIAEPGPLRVCATCAQINTQFPTTPPIAEQPLD